MMQVIISGLLPIIIAVLVILIHSKNKDLPLSVEFFGHNEDERRQFINYFDKRNKLFVPGTLVILFYALSAIVFIDGISIGLSKYGIFFIAIGIVLGTMSMFPFYRAVKNLSAPTPAESLLDARSRYVKNYKYTFVAFFLVFF